MSIADLGNKNLVTVSYLADRPGAALGKTAMRNCMPMPPPGDVLKTNADVLWAAKELVYALATPH